MFLFFSLAQNYSFFLKSDIKKTIKINFLTNIAIFVIKKIFLL
ncbi:hypothetical protein FEM08_04420 [Flavobacterium gilvum]|nr:hypothetical protein FEM08_04420 [Flavobacterium gilvum]